MTLKRLDEKGNSPIRSLTQCKGPVLCYAGRVMAKGKKKQTTGKASGPQLTGDPNLPSRDGPYVSEHGGLIFVGCIWGLVLVAIVSQLLAG